ncbi:hypothetical protein [Neobacillus mesonae]|uniref:hypothetical protein n=1 Tax=Neobacillus mesonae TaxID=1193713 RepID=UPI0020405012|nr:hypothetical protein [Neobacillus mesonae]MCM3570925.1 hypothetical protein [Neobacillus mesonae]
MRDALDYFLIAQAIITGIIVYSIQQLSDSIKASASFIATRDVQLSWGTELGIPTISLILLIGVVGLGVL